MFRLLSFKARNQKRISWLFETRPALPICVAVRCGANGLLIFKSNTTKTNSLCKTSPIFLCELDAKLELVKEGQIAVKVPV